VPGTDFADTDRKLLTRFPSPRYLICILQSCRGDQTSTLSDVVCIVATGGENDDGGGWDFRGVLAADARLLHPDVAPARNHVALVHPGGVPRHLLARHVQLHVQPHHLLLDEFQVGHIYLLSFQNTHFQC
jgi:hypothetical protein